MGEAYMIHLKRRKTDATVTGDHCRRFGAIAVQKGFVSLEEIKAAMAEQIDDDINGREHRLLGTILFNDGFTTENEVDKVLQELAKTL